MIIEGILSSIIAGAAIGALGHLALPDRRHASIWLTILVGFVSALIGWAVALALGFVITPGMDWIELALTAGMAAAGVSLLVGARRQKLS